VSLPSIKSTTFWRRTASLGAAFILVYLAVAYVLVPALWKRYARRHQSFEDTPRLTHTHDGHPGDPLNVALIGTDRQLKTVMIAAGWYPADPLSLKSRLEIAEATVLKRPYDAAPVSNLYLFGRKEDLAFEKPVGKDPRQRHHVRFWRTEQVEDDRPIWVGAAIYDRKVGISHTTGQITHHTAPDIDTERDYLFHDLEQTGDLSEVFVVDDFHQVREGRNGGGDPWHTDGNLYAGVISADKTR
jgi:hypothetical protein